MLQMLDPLWIMIMIPGLLLSLIASGLVKRTFAKYSKVRCQSGYTGAQVAEAILHAHGVQDVTVEQVAGRLSDHYDPRSKTVRLSPEVYDSNSVAALGVAAHETGHAIQHAEKYAPLVLRNAAVPLANFGTNFAYMIFFAGMMINWMARGSSPLAGTVMNAGIILFAAVVFFTIITLPVEINASTRAVALLTQSGIVTMQERSHVKKVLTAAALTYVAAAIAAILQLLYMILRSRD